jgi:hypothetical protein
MMASEMMPSGARAVHRKQGTHATCWGPLAPYATAQIGEETDIGQENRFLLCR